MSDKMWALIKEIAAPGLVMKQVPVPSIGPNDVLIKIKKTSICGTDVHIYNWDEWATKNIKPPLIIGHEFVGEIVALGENVQGLTIGERVSGEGHIVCGKCRNCFAGRRHYCPNTISVGVNRDGAFAEYLSIPYTNVWQCKSDISNDIISCFDPLGNAAHAALTYDVTGEDVLITGAGPIGIMAAAICRHNGARNVVITDINEDRLTLARRFNITRAVNTAKENLDTVIKELKMTEGFDIGLEMSGSSVAFNQIIDHLANYGKIALLGFIEVNTTINWHKIIMSGITIKGIYGREMFETWYKMTAMLQSGLNIEPIITHRFDARDFEQGFAAMINGNSGKVILDWTKL